MGNATAVQSSFAGGEISPNAQGRFDLPTYKKSLNVCRNGFPIETEAWTRRPGAQWARETVAGAAARVIKFDFSSTAPYTCEFGVGGTLSFRVGATLVTTNDDRNVVSISAANPAVLLTNGAHGWATNDIVFLRDLGGGVPVLQNRQFKITVTSATQFSLADAITGASIDGAALGAALTVGNVSRRRVIATPYTALALLAAIQLVQTDGGPSLNSGLPFAYVFCAGLPVYQLAVTAAPTASAFATFALTQILNATTMGNTAGFRDGPYLDPDQTAITNGVYLTASALTGSITLTPSAGTVFTSDNVGQLIRLFSQPPVFTGSGNYAAGEQVTVYSPFGTQQATNATYWYSLVAGNVANPPFSPAAWSVAVSPAAYWTWGLITSVAAGVATVSILGNDLVSAKQNGVTLSPKIYLWRLGLYGGLNGWPTCGTYHEGRIVMSGVAPNRIDASQSNKIAPLYMGPTEFDGTVTPANGYSYVFNAPDANPIFWLIPDIQGIICGTQAGEWLVQATAVNEPLTPLSVQAHRNTTVGCANIEPVRCELTIAFVQRYQRKVMEYFPDVFSGKLTAPNLSENAMHMTTGFVEEVRFQHSVIPLLWTRDANGNLFGATYRRTKLFASEKPDFIGWHRHDLGSGYSVESITVGPSVDGALDTLTMVTQTPGGVNSVELLTDHFNEDGTLADAIFLDSATQPTSWTIGVAVPTTAPYGTLTLNGLWHFNGATVQVWAAGLDCGDYAVSNGSLTIPFGDSVGQFAAGGVLTQAAWNASQVAWVGFTFTSQGQGLAPVDPREAGTQAGLAVGKVQRSQQFSAKLVNAGPGGAYGGVKFGGDFATLHRARFKTRGGKGATILAQTVMFTGTYWDALDDEHSYQGSTLCWQIDRPYPFTMTASVLYDHTQDR